MQLVLQALLHELQLHQTHLQLLVQVLGVSWRGARQGVRASCLRLIWITVLQEPSQARCAQYLLRAMSRQGMSCGEAWHTARAQRLQRLRGMRSVAYSEAFGNDFSF